MIEDLKTATPPPLTCSIQFLHPLVLPPLPQVEMSAKRAAKQQMLSIKTKMLAQKTKKQTDLKSRIAKRVSVEKEKAASDVPRDDFGRVVRSSSSSTARKEGSSSNDNKRGPPDNDGRSQKGGAQKK